MKKMIFFTMVLIFTFNISSAQMLEGVYSFSNDVIVLGFSITRGGSEISEITVTNNTNGEVLEGKGIYRKANNIEWYEFQTDKCNYDFDLPKDQLILNQFDCKDGQQKIVYTLKLII